jgi:protein SCO1/2
MPIRKPALGLLASLALVAPSNAQLLEDAPAEVQGIGIQERLGAEIPLHLAFRDESGREVTLASLFRSDRPVLVNLVYFDCPMLCSVFLDGFVDVLGRLDWTPGAEFEIVTVSIDPKDDAAGAARKRTHFVEKLGRPEAAAGWHFLTGDEAAVKQLADSLGFSFRYLEDRGEYAHSAGLFVATPEGRISRVLTGVAFEPQTLRLSLVEASNGKIGGPMDQILLFCFAYDHTAGRYGPTAMRVMRIFGALTLVVLATFLALNWRRDLRRHRAPHLGASS